MGLAPTTAAGFEQMFANKNDMVWSGGDQVTSFKYNGFTYWLFGDSMLSNGEDPDGSYPEGAVMVSNRILLQQGDQLVNAMANGGNGIPDQPSHTSANQRRHWTQAMFVANGNLYVLGARVESSPDGLGFKTKGVELARYTQNTTTGLLTFSRLVATPSTAIDGGAGPLQIHFSGDAVVAADGYVYLYGTTMAEGNPYVIHYSYVARVPVAQVENPFAWKFYAKSSGTWKNTMAELDQSDLGTQADSILAGQISSVRYINGKYVILDKPWNGWGSDVRANTSTSPVGPFTETVIFQSPEGVTPGGQAYQTYSPQLHPEQVLASGKTLVSIAWNGKTLADVMADADLGKPRFYEIQF